MREAVISVLRSGGPRGLSGHRPHPIWLQTLAPRTKK